MVLLKRYWWVALIALAVIGLIWFFASRADASDAVESVADDGPTGGGRRQALPSTSGSSSVESYRNPDTEMGAF